MGRLGPYISQGIGLKLVFVFIGRSVYVSGLSRNRADDPDNYSTSRRPMYMWEVCEPLDRSSKIQTWAPDMKTRRQLPTIWNMPIPRVNFLYIMHNDCPYACSSLNSRRNPKPAFFQMHWLLPRSSVVWKTSSHLTGGNPGPRCREPFGLITFQVSGSPGFL